jgi:hypothetical protein
MSHRRKCRWMYCWGRTPASRRGSLCRTQP